MSRRVARGDSASTSNGFSLDFGSIGSKRFVVGRVEMVEKATMAKAQQRKEQVVMNQSTLQGADCNLSYLRIA